MKLGLLTSIREDHYLPGENFIKRGMTNLSPMYLASYIEKQGIDVEVIIKDNFEDLISFQPEIIGVSSVTENIEFAKKIATQAKQLWNPITILGGVHITSLPKTLSKDFDIGVIGEGEETICQLLHAILCHEKLPSQEKLSKIPGIVFHTPRGVYQTPFHKGVSQLDDIPFPRRQQFIKKMGVTYMMTSRGCPYTCNFCVIPNISEGYRKHSPRYVVKEISSIKEHFPQVESIRIFDDLYIVDRKRVEEIADLVEAEGLSQELAFGCWGRANLIDEKMIKVFQKMNMLYVAFGAESGSSRVLSQIKPGVSIEQNQRAIDLLHDSGIGATCSIIMGHPIETEDDLWATYEFIEKNSEKLTEVEFNVAIPWPGTELWHIAKKRGIVNDEMDFTPLKECAYFPNYCTDLYPYLNERIPPERFDVIMSEFKKLFWKLVKREELKEVGRVVNPNMEIAQLF